MSTATRATLEDLYRFEGKAELIGGRIVEMATGKRPNYVAGNIYLSLRLHIRQTGKGGAYTDGMGFTVAELPSGRESFSPDVSFYDGPEGDDEDLFLEGPPSFAVEVRSRSDYGTAAEADQAAKRDDYFLAGTLVVWDVAPRYQTVVIYRRENLTQPTVLRRGDLADAEPAVPGCRISVDEILAK